MVVVGSHSGACSVIDRIRTCHPGCNALQACLRASGNSPVKWCQYQVKLKVKRIAYLSIPIRHRPRHSRDERHIEGLRRAIPSPFV